MRDFEAHGLRLVVFIDGGVDDAKLGEWQSRRVKDLQKVERVVGSLREGKDPPTAAWMPPPNISKAVVSVRPPSRLGVSPTSSHGRGFPCVAS